MRASAERQASQQAAKMRPVIDAHCATGQGGCEADAEIQQCPDQQLPQHGRAAPTEETAIARQQDDLRADEGEDRTGCPQGRHAGVAEERAQERAATDHPITKSKAKRA